MTKRSTRSCGSLLCINRRPNLTIRILVKRNGSLVQKRLKLIGIDAKMRAQLLTLQMMVWRRAFGA